MIFILIVSILKKKKFFVETKGKEIIKFLIVYFRRNDSVGDVFDKPYNM